MIKFLKLYESKIQGHYQLSPSIDARNGMKYINCNNIIGMREYEAHKTCLIINDISRKKKILIENSLQDLEKALLSESALFVC